jgi:hypothetical protein
VLAGAVQQLQRQSDLQRVSADRDHGRFTRGRGRLVHGDCGQFGRKNEKDIRK